MIDVVGIGLDGAGGISTAVQRIVEQATFLVGSDRHLNYFPHHPARRWVLGELHQGIAAIRAALATGNEKIVVLVSGDPLFFGWGRLLLAELPPEELTFHPHLNAIQLAFNRIKLPWQDAIAISAHGRSLDELTQALQQGAEKIAVLTDSTNTPQAIAQLLLALSLPSPYQMWVCENLGGEWERVQSFPLGDIGDLAAINQQKFALLNVVVLLRQSEFSSQNLAPLNLEKLPLLGLPDASFLSFSDRPGLMTKREVRILALGELALQPGQIIWDIGAGTGSVSIEIARLFPTSQIYAIEKTSAGTMLIEQNCWRFQVKNVVSIHGDAPEILQHLAAPNRIFIGGSGGNLVQILETCAAKLLPSGTIVLALATVEHLSIASQWFRDNRNWHYQMLQVNLSRSVPIAQLTRFSPLNPVTILTATRP
jgi:precorrin-6Y C5,15-methyltransferase (decarboxylating)